MCTSARHVASDAQPALPFSSLHHGMDHLLILHCDHLYHRCSCLPDAIPLQARCATPAPAAAPTAGPTAVPTAEPTAEPTVAPTRAPVR